MADKTCKSCCKASCLLNPLFSQDIFGAVKWITFSEGKANWQIHRMVFLSVSPLTFSHFNSASPQPVAVSQSSVTSVCSLLWYATRMLIKLQHHRKLATKDSCLVVATNNIPPETQNRALKHIAGRVVSTKKKFFTNVGVRCNIRPLSLKQKYTLPAYFKSRAGLSKQISHI